jgi:hypothetical protein
MRKTATLLLALVTALVAGPLPSWSQADKLTGLAAWNALVGNTVTGTLENREFADHYLPDGTVKSTVDGEILSGKWSLEGESICFVYPGEPKECYEMEVTGDTATFTDKSGYAIRARILKGNPKNL